MKKVETRVNRKKHWWPPCKKSSHHRRFFKKGKNSPVNHWWLGIELSKTTHKNQLFYESDAYPPNSLTFSTLNSTIISQVMYPLNSFKVIQTQILCRYYYILTPSPYLRCQLNINDYIFSLLFFLCVQIWVIRHETQSQNLPSWSYGWQVSSDTNGSPICPWNIENGI